jgi:hypothetical protein
MPIELPDRESRISSVHATEIDRPGSGSAAISVLHPRIAASAAIAQSGSPIPVGRRATVIPAGLGSPSRLTAESQTKIVADGSLARSIASLGKVSADLLAQYSGSIAAAIVRAASCRSARGLIQTLPTLLPAS